MNEVGHDKKHLQNVHIRSIHDDVVLYYLCLPEPLGKGV